MKITIQNEQLKAVFDDKGAELQSLYNTGLNIEYMWSGDAAFWGKYSPVLFPVVGSFKADTYLYKGKKYHLPRHGFAREKIFQVEKTSDSELVFTLTQDENTLTVYPFRFNLKIRYTLLTDTLTCSYEVNNPDENELYFSIGAHPAFAVPMVNDTVYADYYLAFNKNEILNRWKLADGLIGTGTEAVITNNNRLPLSYELFYEDAIVIKNMESNCITLGSDKHPHGLDFKFKDFPFFGIWASKNASFVCLEPWCGIADSINHNQELTEKEGIISLPPEASWQRSWSVHCF